MLLVSIELRSSVVCEYTDDLKSSRCVYNRWDKGSADDRANAILLMTITRFDMVSYRSTFAPFLIFQTHHCEKTHSDENTLAAKKLQVETRGEVDSRSCCLVG